MKLDRDALTGVYCALVTPADPQGDVDRAAAERLVDYVVGSGAAGLVPVGGTGEYTALSPGARRDMVEITVAAARGRVPVVAGVLSPGWAEAIAAGRDFRDAGADGLLLITPFYARPTQDACRAYFARYAEAVDLPILLYDIPGRTGVVVDPRTVEAMTHDGSIVGMKACNTDLVHYLGLMERVGDRIAVLGGEEPFLATHVAMGATGGILATSNVIPRIWNRIFDLARAGDLTGALAEQATLGAFLGAVFAETNPGPLKAAMAMADLAVGEALAPLGPPSAATAARLAEAVPPILERERALAADRLSAAG